MIRKSIGMVIAVFAISPAFADVTAVCKLADDKRTVTVAFTNPSSQTMACDANCDMAVPNGFGTVSCSKQVPGGATDLVLCTEVKKGGVEYSRVKGVETNCRDVNAAAAPAEQDKDADKDADEDDDAEMQRIQKQAQELLNQMKKK